ncbi:hypothetical protein [Glaciihabitans sp. UYNi722]
MSTKVWADPPQSAPDSLNYSYQVSDKHRQTAGATFIAYVSRRPPRHD